MRAHRQPLAVRWNIPLADRVGYCDPDRPRFHMQIDTLFLPHPFLLHSSVAPPTPTLNVSLHFRYTLSQLIDRKARRKVQMEGAADEQRVNYPLIYAQNFIIN